MSDQTSQSTWDAGLSENDRCKTSCGAVFLSMMRHFKKRKNDNASNKLPMNEIFVENVKSEVDERPRLNSIYRRPVPRTIKKSIYPHHYSRLRVSSSTASGSGSHLGSLDSNEGLRNDIFTDTCSGYLDGEQRRDTMGNTGISSTPGYAACEHRRRACSMPPFPHSILKHRQSVLDSHKRHQKRTPLSDDISYFNEEQSSDVSCNPDSHDTQEVDGEPNFTQVADDSMSVSERKLTQSIDSRGRYGTCMFLSIEVNDSCDVRLTDVKCMDDGKCFVISVTKKTIEGRTPCRITKQMPLHVRVDPSSVKTNITNRGVLTVIASVMS